MSGISPALIVIPAANLTTKRNFLIYINFFQKSEKKTSWKNVLLSVFFLKYLLCLKLKDMCGTVNHASQNKSKKKRKIVHKMCR